MRTTSVIAAALLSTTALAADSKPAKSEESASTITSVAASKATGDSDVANQLFSDEAHYAAAQATATSANKALQDYLRLQTAVPAASINAQVKAWNAAVIKGESAPPLPGITALPKSLAAYESVLYAGEKSIIEHDVKSGVNIPASAINKEGIIVFATESGPSAKKTSSGMATMTGSGGSTPSGSAGNGGGSSTSSGGAPKSTSGAEGRGSAGVAVLCMAAVAGLAGLMSMM